MFGPITNPKNEGLNDLSLRERLVFAPLILLIIGMGMYPHPFLERINPTSNAAVAAFNLKRCASIVHAGSTATEATMMSEISGCEDPEAKIIETYGDDRRFADAPPVAARAVAPAPADGPVGEAH